MTKRELIEFLNRFPDDIRVLVNGYEGGFSDIVQVAPIKVKLNVHSEAWMGAHDDMDDADLEAVLLQRKF